MLDLNVSRTPSQSPDSVRILGHSHRWRGFRTRVSDARSNGSDARLFSDTGGVGAVDGRVDGCVGRAGVLVGTVRPHRFGASARDSARHFSPVPDGRGGTDPV